MFSKIDKAIAAVVVNLLAIAAAATGVEFLAEPNFAAGVQAVVTGLVVYFIPNKV